MDADDPGMHARAIAGVFALCVLLWRIRRRDTRRVALVIAMLSTLWAGRAALESTGLMSGAVAFFAEFLWPAVILHVAAMALGLRDKRS